MREKEKIESIYFNFHDMVCVRIHTACMNAYNFFISQYKHYKVDRLPDHLPCVSLDFNRSRMPSSRLKGYTRHTHKCLASFDYKIRFTDHHIHINVIGNKISIPIVHHMLLHPGLRYLVSKTHGIMLHASAVSKEGRTILFTGPSGSGKTASAAMIVSQTKNEWQFYSDDYVFCITGSQSLPYETPLHIYQYLFRCLPLLRHRLTIRESLKIHLFGFIRQISRHKIKWPVRIDSDRIWQTSVQNMKSTTLALMLISPSSNGNFKASLIKPDVDLMNKLSDINFQEVNNFLFLVQKSKSIVDFSNWENDWRKRETENFTRLIEKISIYQIEYPWIKNRINRHRFDLFFQFIEDTISLS